MTTFDALKKQMLANPKVRERYDALEQEFAVARELIQARNRAGLSQAQVAKRMGTTQSAIARLESGRRSPSMRTLARFAEATGTRAEIRLVAVTRRHADKSSKKSGTAPKRRTSGKRTRPRATRAVKR